MKTSVVLFALTSLMLMISGCNTKTDYNAWSTWEFINDSSYSLHIDGGEDVLTFGMEKGEIHSFDIKFRSDKDIDPDSFISPFRDGATKITLNGKTEITATPIVDTANYKSKKVGDRHFKFTYTFTDADFPTEE